MKKIILGLFVILSVAIANQRPNVILIFSDDQGAYDMGCYGSTDLYTPNLDQLAHEGIRFTQFYSAASVCSPSRAALLTGKYPHRAGVPNNAESHPSTFGTTGHGLKEEQVTIAEILKSVGYKTAHLGKWHLGIIPGPNKQGLDLSVGFMGGCIDHWSHINYGQAPWGKEKWHDWYRNGIESWETGKHAGDIMVDEAIQFLQNAGDAPVFLYMAFASPHYPMNTYNKYQVIFKELDEPRRSYAATLATLDEQIGSLVSAIEKMGERDNTIIIFQSDHGHSNEARNNYGGGNPGKLRGAKVSLFEGGIRVPSIISWPGHIPQNETRDQFGVACDWLPTIAELCGAELPDHKIDGKSLVKVIQQNEKTPHDYWHWAFGQQWAARKGEWKLLKDIIDTSDGRHRIDVEGPFLANLEKDETEHTNFADDYPEVVKELMDIHEQWVEEMDKINRK